MAEVETPAAETKAPVTKIDAAAEKAYAEAAAKVVDAPKPVKVPAKPALKAETAKKAVAPAAKKPVAKKPAAKKVAAKKTAAKKIAAPKKPVPAKKAAPKAKTPVAAAAAPKTNPVIKLKDTIMATAKNTDITATAKEMLADVQARAKTAYAKSAELAGEAGEFGKANVDAVVESGKIFFAGAQEIVRSDLETGKAVIETVTEDAKKVASVKSPTELMQLQGEIARRNFDAMVAFGSKRTETLMKLYNDAFAPISNRVSVAAEKVTKAA